MGFWNVITLLAICLVVVAAIVAGVIYSTTDSPKIERSIGIGLLIVGLVAGGLVLADLAWRREFSCRRKGW